MTKSVLGIIGGSGIYDLPGLENVTEKNIETPWGVPSAPLRVGEIAGHCQAFPRDTADAVESGIVAALCGAVRQQHGLLAERVDKPPRVLLTGGDAGLLLPHLGLPLEHVPALVLEGIDCVARERTS